MISAWEYSAQIAADEAARASRRAKTRNKPSTDVKKRFYASVPWKRLRYKIIAEQGGKCQACGRSAKDGIVINVDHIVPLSKDWSRRLDKTNLQVLCGDCNHGKLHLSQEDWRPAAE